MADTRTPLSDDSLKTIEKPAFKIPVDSGYTIDPKTGEMKISELAVQSLQDEIARLQSENLSLKKSQEQILVQRVRTPDDFATALTHSVDSLQTRMSQMKNPVCNFAIREMTLETNVHIEVTELGTIDYRFIGPNDDIKPEKLSKIRINLVPLPKESPACSWTQRAFTPYADIDEIQGIGDTFKKKLNEHQIFTVSDLLNASTRMRSKIELASMLEVDHNRLGEWVSHAELMTIRPIDGKMAEVLFKTGISSLELLAKAQKETLTVDYNNQVKKMKVASLAQISEKEASEWIGAAKSWVGQAGKEAKGNS